MTSDFRPKFPLDPFAAIPHSAREPWIMNADRLSSPPARDVLLVLGASSFKDLELLLYSAQLSSSLLIVVTPEPLSIPTEGPIQPAIRILRLSSPLGLENAGSVRFVNVLEWAERVARLWRKRGDQDILELTEDSTMSDLGPAKARSHRLSTLSWSTPPSPRASATSLIPSTPSTPPSRSSSPRPQLLEKRRDARLPQVDPSQRAFDGIINFLPPTLPDRPLLKYMILVTTISRPFLIAAVPISQARRSPTKSSVSRRRSLLVRPTSVYSLASTSNSIYSSGTSPAPSLIDFPSSALAPPTNGHVVHLVPRSNASSKLLQSMETFLLSFCYPATHNPQSRPPEQRMSPFLMDARTFCASVPIAGTTSEPTVADAILAGALDLENSANNDWQVPPRAWISGPVDIILSSHSQLRSLPQVCSSLSMPMMSRAPPTSDSLPALSEGYLSVDSTPPGTPGSDTGLVYPSSGLRKVMGSELLPTPPDSEEENGGQMVKPKRSRWRFWRGVSVAAR